MTKMELLPSADAQPSSLSSVASFSGGGSGGSAVSYVTPSIALGSVAAAGSLTGVIRGDSTIKAFDTTAPSATTLTAVIGVINYAARRDHVHAIDQTITPVWTGLHTFSGGVAINTIGSVTSNMAVFALLNATVTTMNFAGAATALNLGAATGTITFGNPALVGAATLVLFNTVSTSISFAGAATTLGIGAATGTLTFGNPTIVGAATLVLFNTVSTSISFGGAATTLNLGASTGTATLANATTQFSGTQVNPTTGYNTNLGLLTKKFLAIHAAELWVETLVAASTLATIGGRILVGPTTTLTVDLAPAGTTISVKQNNLANGDRVYLEANGSVEFMAIASVASGAGPYTYTVTRNLDGSGANQWYAGDAVFNTGSAGSGFIDLYSVAGVKTAGIGPTIVGNVRNSATYNDWTEHWAIGNLNGVYGYGSTTFGAAFGKYAASNTWIAVDATNGLRIVNGTTTVIGQWSAAGVITVGEVAASKGNVQISSGAINLRLNTTSKIQLQSDGDLFIGTDVSAAATTSLSVFTNAQTYNAESLSAGNILIGDNSSGKYNILVSTGGSISLRLQTTAIAQIDSNGVHMNGGYLNTTTTTQPLNIGDLYSGRVLFVGAAAGAATGTAGDAFITRGLNVGTATSAGSGDIQASGSIRVSTVLGARVFHSVNQAVGSGTNTALALDSERWDTDAIHDTVTNNSRLTCKTAGKYLISASISWAASSAGTVRQISIRLNGATYICSQTGAISGVLIANNVTVSTVYDLAVNDYVEAMAFQDSGGNLNVLVGSNYSPEFSMARIA